LCCRLLAPRRTIDSRDDIIWLSFLGWTQKIPLAFVVAVVVWAPQIAILTRRENRSRIFSSCSDQSCIISRRPAMVFGLFRQNLCRCPGQ
jgi:hypothetical protein